MVQRAARAEDSPQPTDSPFSGTPEELGRGWVVLRDCRLGPPAPGGSRTTVLLHPARGVAVLDIPPSETPGAAEAVRAKLDAARFHAAFEGRLPVVQLQVPSDQMPLLPLLLDETFAEQPPLHLPAGDAWVGAAARALAAEPPAPRPEPRRPLVGPGGPKRRRPPPRKRGAAVLRTVGAVLLCLAALGGVLGAVLNILPETAPRASAPGSAAAPVIGEAPAPWASAVSSQPVPDPGSDAPPLLPARADADAAMAGPAPEAPPSAPRSPTPVARPPLPVLVEPPPPPPSPPQRAATPPRRPEATASPTAAPVSREAPERSAPRRQREAAGAALPVAGAGASLLHEDAPDRCRRVSALAGSGLPLTDADIRFFNEACIRW